MAEDKKILEEGDLLLKTFGSIELAVAVWCGESIDSVMQDYFCGLED